MKFTPHTKAEIAEMLEVIGVKSVDDLFAGIPEAYRISQGLGLSEPMTEPEVLDHMAALASENTTIDQTCSFLGAGANDHYIPAAIAHLTGRGEFLTAYTPYQPELSQGTLQAQFEFQTMVADLLGLDVANASMYEGATALSEACLMALRHTRRSRVLVSRAVHPEYRQVLATYLGLDQVDEIPLDAHGATDLAALESACDDGIGAVVIQSPNFLGVVEDVGAAATIAHDHRALAVSTFTEPLAFGMIEPPGGLGADIAAGEGQSFGLSLSFGGPYVGLFAVRSNLVKFMPGRLVGMTSDARGNPCYTLTLAAREQHIRRARASSNICTNEGLCATAVAIYLSLLGREGLPRLARYNHHRAERLKSILADVPGLSLPFDGPTFNEFVVRLPGTGAAAVERLSADGMVPGFALGEGYPELEDCLLVSVTERKSDDDFKRLASALRST